MKVTLTKTILVAGIYFCSNSFTVAQQTREFHHPQQFVEGLQGDKQAGKKIYQQFCQVCHAISPQVNVGAPRIGVEADWQIRRKQSINKMLINIDNGMTTMPARGGCFECSDEQLKAAIEYMLPSSQKKNK